MLHAKTAKRDTPSGSRVVCPISRASTKAPAKRRTLSADCSSDSKAGLARNPSAGAERTESHDSATRGLLGILDLNSAPQLEVLVAHVTD